MHIHAMKFLQVEEDYHGSSSILWRLVCITMYCDFVRRLCNNSLLCFSSVSCSRIQCMVYKVPFRTAKCARFYVV